MVMPKDIKESLIDKPIIQELIKKIDEELLKEDKIKDAICGKVIIEIPKNISFLCYNYDYAFIWRIWLEKDRGRFL